MGKKLSEVEIGRYGRDGFVCPIEAFRPDQAHGYLDRLEAFEQRDGKQFGKGHNFKPHLLFTWVDEIVHHPARARRGGRFDRPRHPALSPVALAEKPA